MTSKITQTGNVVTTAFLRPGDLIEDYDGHREVVETVEPTDQYDYWGQRVWLINDRLVTTASDGWFLVNPTTKVGN